MSEADNAWRLVLDEGVHDVEVSHSTMTGRIVVSVDGRPVAQDRLFLRQKDVGVPLEGHRVVVSVDFANLGLGARSQLHVDGRYVEPLRR